MGAAPVGQGCDEAVERVLLDESLKWQNIHCHQLSYSSKKTFIMLCGLPRYCKTLVRVLLGEDLGFIGRPVMPSDARSISVHRPAVQNRQTEIEASQRARKRHSHLDTNTNRLAWWMLRRYTNPAVTNLSDRTTIFMGAASRVKSHLLLGLFFRPYWTYFFPVNSGTLIRPQWSH